MDLRRAGCSEREESAADLGGTSGCRSDRRRADRAVRVLKNQSSGVKRCRMKRAKRTKATPAKERRVPAAAISLFEIFPVANAIAFGGVLIGRLIASEEDKATVIAARIGDHAEIATASGIRMLAADVLLMKVERINVTSANAIVVTISWRDSKGTRLTSSVERQVFSMPTPRERPPATRMRTSQSIRLRSWASITPVTVKTATGRRAASAVGTPCSGSVIQSRTVVAKVPVTIIIRGPIRRGAANFISIGSASGEKNISKTIQSRKSRARAIGTPISIHSMNEIGFPRPARTLAATAFGGVPMIVPIPPIFAENGTASTTAFESFFRAMLPRRYGATIALIIAVVAVFDMNRDKSAVMRMIPSKTHLGFWPNGWRNAFASR